MPQVLNDPTVLKFNGNRKKVMVTDVNGNPIDGSPFDSII